MLRNKNIKLILNYFVGPLVFLLLSYSIYSQLLRQPNWTESLAHIKDSFDGKNVWALVAVLVLMFVNWGVEARKWQLAIRRLQPIGFFRSMKAIFTGTTMAFFTPNRMGEYVGRLLYVKKGARISSIPVTIVCSIAQLLVTLSFGIAGLFYIRMHSVSVEKLGVSFFWINLLLIVIIAIWLVLTVLFFRLSWAVRLLERLPKLQPFIRYIKVLEDFNATLLFRFLSLSIVRYLVFILQYYLLFRIFNVDIGWWQSFWSVSVVFLILAILPSVAVLTELGVRWKASIELVQLFSTNTVGILTTSLGIWIVNLVIPALIGSLLILGIRIADGKKEKVVSADRRTI